MSGSNQNFTRTMTRLRPDFDRIAQALKRPGIDPRSWLNMARVDEDPDAIVWDAQVGWLVDVTFVGGALDGEGPVVCRVSSWGQGQGVTSQRPPRPDCLVLVAVPGGDPNEECVIVGQLHDEVCKPPAAVNGTTITEEFALETHFEVFPGEDLDAEYRNVRITAESMTLGAAAADQPFPRGNDLADALDNLADSLDALAAALTTSGSVIGTSVSGGAVTAAIIGAVTAPLQTAVASFKAARTGYLSSRITGD